MNLILHKGTRKVEERGLTMLVEIVISIILIILILSVVGYIVRKRYYREVDRLDTKKLELMNRPVAEELAKIKRLNMTGQTEEMFERWRKSWDEIVAVQFPEIDEMLFYAEEHTDKYRFKQAKEAHIKIEKSLQTIELEIDRILQELNDLVGSEEKSRTEVEKLAEGYMERKRYLLAHRHLFGVVASHLEQLVETIGNQIKNYEELTNEGNYFEAREVVLSLANNFEQLSEKMEKTPDLLTECQTILPSQQSELRDGYKEMKQQGFALDHLQIDEQLEKIENNISSYLSLLEAGKINDVEKGLLETKKTVDTLYELLEKEVYAKHFVLQENEKAEIALMQLKEENDVIINETNIVQNSYQLLDNELELPKRIEKNLLQIAKRYELLKAKMTDEITAYSILEEELKDIDEQIKQMQAEQTEYMEHLQSLRKDELVAKEKVMELQRRVKEIIRSVQQSHMPGLPADFESLFDRTEEQLADVHSSLNEKPLNMKNVQRFLSLASNTVDHLYEKTEEHIETAQLAERVIQYANRYRSRNPELASNLEKAEHAFRNYEYMAALEEAAAAVEKVEPGALKRIEDIYNNDGVEV